MLKKIIQGNFLKDRNIQKSRKLGGQGGWILGHFAKIPFKLKGFEVKYDVKKKGEKKEFIAYNEKAKTLVILIKGKMLINLYSKGGELIKKIILAEVGDYNFFDAGIAHDWIALKDSLTIAIRWPSIPNDQKNLSKSS